MELFSRRNLIRLAVSFLILFSGFLFYLNQPSSQFSVGSIVTVQSGESLSAIASDLKDQHIIRSKILFQAIEILSAGENKLKAEDYYFGHPISTFTVASRIMNGNSDIAFVRVTIPEGSSMKQIADILSACLPHFLIAEFMKYSPAKEGYLFPDTYYFAVNVKVEEVIKTMQNNFDEKIASLQNKITAFGKSEKDIITMASILEEEANNPTDWSMIASILWKRLKIGMPLQVDSTSGLGPTYNTYKNRGLPPTPIGNPGLGTIEAAMTPATTTYLYYLSDNNGVTHYSKTFDEHKANIFKYLK